MSTEQTDTTMVALMADAEKYRQREEEQRDLALEGLRIMGRLGGQLQAIADLHQPEHPDGRRWCAECFDWWPCQTYRIAASQ